MSPRGKPLTQARVRELAAGPGVVIVCGRFEGVDERVIEARGLEEVSIGDYVLSGGEMAAMIVLDACVRLLPGVMGKEASGTEESFEIEPPRISALHAAARMGGAPDPRRAALRQPCRDRALAPRGSRSASRASGGRTCWNRTTIPERRMATQNIYDDPGFFENYSRLPRSKDGLSAAPEWASLQALLPDLAGRSDRRSRMRLWLVLPLRARAGRRRTCSDSTSRSACWRGPKT